MHPELHKYTENEIKEQPSANTAHAHIQPGTVLPGRRAQGSRKGRIQRHAGHTEPRHEAAQGGKSHKPRRQILLRAAQRDDVQARGQPQARRRDAAHVGLHGNQLLGQHGRDKDPPGLCQQPGVQHRQRRNRADTRHDSRRRHDIHSNQGRRDAHRSG